MSCMVCPGMRYDIARGLTANLGVNYSDSEVNVGSVNLVVEEGLSATISLRYSF